MGNPFEQFTNVTPNHRFLGDERCAGALDQVTLQFVQLGARYALYPGTAEDGPRERCVSTNRRQ